MKKIGHYLSAIALGALLLPATVQAQTKSKEKDKEVKDSKESKGVEQIVITRKGDKNEKVVVEINGDKVMINGKPSDEYKGGDVTVNRNRFKEMNALVRAPRARSYGYSYGEGYGNGGNDNFYYKEDENHAMLGVVTEKEDEGAKISEVSKESAAEKAGLKEDDIITKIDDKKIEDPDDLTKAIREHKPGDKVKVIYLRDKKEQFAVAELTKWKGMSFNTFNGNKSFNFSMPDIAETMPKIEVLPRIEGDGYGIWDAYNGRPKLGLSVQDTDDGKGVKVIDVDEEGNAEKAGIKEDDIITSINDKEVNSADEVAKIVRESKDKISIKVNLTRDGKAQTIDVKIPRKLKTADL
ncbi:MAG: PDZ domain-containing protein [Bacteroidota bacterium]